MSAIGLGGCEAGDEAIEGEEEVVSLCRADATEGTREEALEDPGRVFGDAFPVRGEGKPVGATIGWVLDESDEPLALERGEHAANGRFGEAVVLGNGTLVELGPVQDRNENAELCEREIPRCA